MPFSSQMGGALGTARYMSRWRTTGGDVSEGHGLWCQRINPMADPALRMQVARNRITFPV
ncbi:hypothetical protein GCM10009095_13360 [Sphingomonas molluscorum]|nr:hypothetical protein GCM10017606_05630 [Microbacterium terregens]